eukprot:CAMPEP_0201507794 /NCGR_PEP_ID=MMETSP0161_2-20130828/1357_1 /ASSEMBLY_ACC=CAM_ASM_000251 /TAXON_ID=180227 /ORGANISM="Neoparamoeba aestuarina, Strain SoJaBio B1-5/56/2" /LENGTH=75 /DNA_ID=CAMNT_0047902265 /DNA_START=303 /DNA_END=530 /DNA_ORIENTATION=-
MPINLHIAFAVHSIDPSLGKVGQAAFSQQTLMELFLDGITENRSDICGDDNEPKGMRDWRGIGVNTDDEVVEINW